MKFSWSNFIGGYGSIIDLFPSAERPMIARHVFPLEEDDAMRQDWNAVGDDFRSVLYDLYRDGSLHGQAEPPEESTDDAGRRTSRSAR